jgi:hypothetical protein
MKKPERGADTSVYLASSSAAEGLTGLYFARGSPTKSKDASYDIDTTARLWRVSADLVGVSADGPATGR